MTGKTATMIETAMNCIATPPLRTEGNVVTFCEKFGPGQGVRVSYFVIHLR